MQMKNGMGSFMNNHDGTCILLWLKVMNSLYSDRKLLSLKLLRDNH